MKLSGKLAAGMAAILCTGAMFGQTHPFAGPLSPPAAAQMVPPAPADSPGPESGDILDQLQERYTTLFQKVSPAVVRVNAAIPGPTPDALPTAYIWSGFFITRAGDILTTNAHLLQNATQVWVQSGRVSYPAEVKGIDLVTDVAVLHATTLPKDFSMLNLADSPESPAQGTMLMSVTCKEGELPGPSTGMVQGYSVNAGDQALPTLHLRTTIPDDGGEAGSPVVDLHGRLVGIMVASLKESRSSLVLPSRAALRVRDDLLANGKVAYGRLGFVGEQTSDTNSGVRVQVNSVEYGGPALAGGLKAGDEVRILNGTAINNEDDLRQATFYLRPGQDVALGVRRNGQDLQLTLHVGEMQLAGADQPDLKAPAQTADAAVKPSPVPGSLISGLGDLGLPPPPVEKTK